jgi:glycosyltransferase involved in cell wall biosynthesis
MRIFILGIPHTQTTERFTTDAFTMKVWNLCRMMTRLGHQVIHLGTEGSNPECSEHVSVTPKSEFDRLYGHPEQAFYRVDTNGPYAPFHAMYASNARKAILERMGDPRSSIVCIPWGDTQMTAVRGIDQYIVESGIGYPFLQGAPWRVFESYAWMHFHLGRRDLRSGSQWYEVVIPNAFDRMMFDADRRLGNQLLYLGRLQVVKGVQLAVDIAQDVGMPITICGQGDPTPYLRPHVRYVPPVGVEGRKQLLAEARALLCPSFFVEPFGGVAVEAQMAGCPVVCTDWGAFTETVLHGTTGYRCRTHEQFCWAVRNIDRIDSADCRKWAVENFSLEAVAPRYEEYFQQVLDLGNGGWYAPRPARRDLDTRREIFPASASVINPKPAV